ncbi:hypothetical protein [Aureimonas sp. AU4]|uniref:hypothetical protein n=1 Tax=Aureimonas sp. AU4 TaxID=1638163 RepID=UPI000782BFC0|nr:hypothetical protein [Aureimonas sp. AU4]
MIFERRQEPRRSTRLRPGKLLTEGGQFLCDCAVVERSETGARIRAFAPVETMLPENLFLYEEVEARRTRVRIAWAKGAELGLTVTALAEEIVGIERERIAGRYYAVGG